MFVTFRAVGLFRIPLNKCATALERVHSSEQDYDAYRGVEFEKILHMQMPLINLAPSSWLKGFFNSNFGTSAGFTSVPAYSKPAKLLGANVNIMYKLFNLQWKHSCELFFRILF